jgi:hypothetical protein
VFEPSSFGEQLVAEDRIRDYADGQDVELEMGSSSQVFGQCTAFDKADDADEWTPMRAVLTNANPNPAKVRLVLGSPAYWQQRGLAGTRVKDGLTILEVTVPGNGRRELKWETREAAGSLAAALRAALALAILAGAAMPLAAREAVEASAPQSLSVTLYRDPDRGVGDAVDPDWPRGFAMITETRTVTLPPGESTIRFIGVAEGMVAVSAIVTGLPGGTIEKNRNADLLSPASLIDGTLGNRVTVTHTNPATGRRVAEDAIVRTRADGGLVLQTKDGFEAVRCAGLPEKLTFDRVPAGLSALPVFSVDTRDPSGGTYTVQLTYLSWGFDWQANYVATLRESGRGDGVRFGLMSWLTLVNDNGRASPIPSCWWWPESSTWSATSRSSPTSPRRARSR